MLNSLTLFFIGGSIERSYGSYHFLRIFITCASTSCLSAFFSQPPPPYVQPIIGNSAVIAGMVTYFILKYRNATLMFFIIPVPAYAIGGFMLTHSLLFDKSGS